MPKIKTKSGAKKRFKVTGSGKVVHASAYKRHKLQCKTRDNKRNKKGSSVMFDADAHNTKKYFLPNL